MKFAIYNAAGDILRVGQCPDDAVSVQAQEGELLYEGSASLNDRVDTTTGLLILNGKPPKPSAVHVWDDIDKAWVGDIALAKAVKSEAIELERDARVYAPTIEYDGCTVDSDARSQKNVTDKLAVIAQREIQGRPLPIELLFWRDTDNVDHTFPDQDTYKTWLGGLAIEIEERGTLAYAWSFAQKNVLAALTTFEQVQAFVVN